MKGKSTDLEQLRWKKLSCLQTRIGNIEYIVYKDATDYRVCCGLVIIDGSLLLGLGQGQWQGVGISLTRTSIWYNELMKTVE